VAPIQQALILLRSGHGAAVSLRSKDHGMPVGLRLQDHGMPADLQPAGARYAAPLV